MNTGCGVDWEQKSQALASETNVRMGRSKCSNRTLGWDNCGGLSRSMASQSSPLVEVHLVAFVVQTLWLVDIHRKNGCEDRKDHNQMSSNRNYSILNHPQNHTKSPYLMISWIESTKNHLESSINLLVNGFIARTSGAVQRGRRLGHCLHQRHWDLGNAIREGQMDDLEMTWRMRGKLMGEVLDGWMKSTRMDIILWMDEIHQLIYVEKKPWTW